MNATAASPEPVEFRLFGTVEAIVGGQRVDMGTRRDRRLLVALLKARGQPVSRDELLQWVWDDIPDTGSAEFERLMSGLRRRLEEVGLRNVLTAKDGMRRLEIPTQCVDVHHCRALVVKAQTLGPQAATELLREAWERTRGEPMAGLTGERIEGYRTTLADQQRETELAFISVELELGHHREWIGDLARLFDDQPADTGITESLMHALYLSSQLDQVTRVYLRHQRARREHGHDVNDSTMQLHDRILRGDESLRPDSGTRPTEGGDESTQGDDDQSEQEDEGPNSVRLPLASTQRITNFDAPVVVERDFVQGNVTYHQMGELR